MHPLLDVLLARPQLLVDHAQAYGELFTEELDQARVALQRWVMWQSLALCALLMAGILAGVAVMLWAMLPGNPPQALWVLLFTPMVPLACAVGCWLVARRSGSPRAFALLREQISLDMAMLRAARAP